jgi:hypothetical protein
MLGVMGTLARSSGFLTGLLTAGVVSLVAVVLPRRRPRSILLGFAAIVGAFAGLAAEDVLRGALFPAVTLLAAAALVAESRPAVVRAAALAPGGAVLVTFAAPGTSGWARGLVLLAVLVAGPTSAVVDRRFPSLLFAFLAVSALGVYETVPDTEQARALVGALLPVAALAFISRRSPEPAGPVVSVSLLAWVALVGGVGRPGAVVGGIGCLGVLALGPVSRRANVGLLAVVHVAVVAVASRVAGLRQSAWTAAAILVPVMVLAAIVLVAGERGRTRNPP